MCTYSNLYTGSPQIALFSWSSTVGFVSNLVLEVSWNLWYRILCSKVISKVLEVSRSNLSSDTNSIVDDQPLLLNEFLKLFLQTMSEEHDN